MCGIYGILTNGVNINNNIIRFILDGLVQFKTGDMILQEFIV